MNIKPKDIKVNLPVVLTFDNYHDVPEFASTINSILHGRIKVKCEELGLLSGKYIGIFYLDRNHEYKELRKEFIDLISQEEMDY